MAYVIHHYVIFIVHLAFDHSCPQKRKLQVDPHPSWASSFRVLNWERRQLTRKELEIHASLHHKKRLVTILTGRNTQSLNECCQIFGRGWYLAQGYLSSSLHLHLLPEHLPSFVHIETWAENPPFLSPVPDRRSYLLCYSIPARFLPDRYFQADVLCTLFWPCTKKQARLGILGLVVSQGNLGSTGETLQASNLLK